MERKVKEEQRIEKEAVDYLRCRPESSSPIRDGYIAGATKEAERAKVLIDCLNEILPLHTGYKEDGEMISTNTGLKIRKALQDYNQNK